MLDEWEDSIDLQDRNDVFIFIDWYIAPKGPSFLCRVDVAKLIFVRTAPLLQSCDLTLIVSGRSSGCVLKTARYWINFF